MFTHSLVVKTVLFQSVPFSISAQFSSICSIDRTLSDATTPDQSAPGGYGNYGVPTFPKAPALQEPHHQKGPFQELPLRVRVRLGAMVFKGYPNSPKLQHYKNLTIRLFSVMSRTLVVCVGGGLLRCSRCIL